MQRVSRALETSLARLARADMLCRQSQEIVRDIRVRYDEHGRWKE